MLKLLWVVMLLVGILLFTNIREVVTRYFVDYNKTKLITYMFPLLMLGYLVLHLTFNIMDMAIIAEQPETDEVECPRFATAASLFRLNKRVQTQAP